MTPLDEMREEIRDLPETVLAMLRGEQQGMPEEWSDLDGGWDNEPAADLEMPAREPPVEQIFAAEEYDQPEPIALPEGPLPLANPEMAPYLDDLSPWVDTAITEIEIADLAFEPTPSAVAAPLPEINDAPSQRDPGMPPDVPDTEPIGLETDPFAFPEPAAVREPDRWEEPAPDLARDLSDAMAVDYPSGEKPELADFAPVIAEAAQDTEPDFPEPADAFAPGPAPDMPDTLGRDLADELEVEIPAAEERTEPAGMEAWDQLGLHEPHIPGLPHAEDFEQTGQAEGDTLARIALAVERMAEERPSGDLQSGQMQAPVNEAQQMRWDLMGGEEGLLPENQASPSMDPDDLTNFSMPSIANSRPTPLHDRRPGG